ncbi:hypothetical protein PF010_g11101 [Phytophthora fragariae]|uniref:Secreted protein n=1 Tax=Phytophthora fragariae TaxID=53985 RepID=A0A6G0NXE7_9STRA|nr:hypothetical protein PF010_g11101 [Phytophthora fragariae]KAE9226390.1 hypothetical protein PF004_g11656 [Phytophthora fragariae]
MSIAGRPAAWVATVVQLVLQHVLTCAVPPSSSSALHHAATPDSLLIRSEPPIAGRDRFAPPALAAHTAGAFVDRTAAAVVGSFRVGRWSSSSSRSSISRATCASRASG